MTPNPRPPGTVLHFVSHRPASGPPPVSGALTALAEASVALSIQEPNG
jgi:hypothetical protein